MSFLMVLSCYGLAQGADAKVWHWTDIKAAEKFVVLVTTVDGKVVSRIKIPVYRQTRAAHKLESQRIIEYYFFLQKRAGRVFICNISTGKVEGNVWEAGKEKNGTIFGISWVINRYIVLNTLHLAIVDQTEVFTPEAGVKIKSYWLKKGED